MHIFIFNAFIMMNEYTNESLAHQEMMKSIHGEVWSEVSQEHDMIFFFFLN